MNLASPLDVQERLGRDLTEGEQARVPGLLAEASALVEGYLGVVYTDGDEVPSTVTLVVSRMVARVLSQAQGTPIGLESRQVGTGPFQQSDRYGADTTLGGPWLARVDRDMLSPLVSRSAVSVRLSTDHR